MIRLSSTFLIALIHLNKGSSERYNISEAIAIIQCKGYGEIMLGYQPIHGLQILFLLWVSLFGENNEYKRKQRKQLNLDD